MSNTLELLKTKANALTRKLRAIGIEIPPEHRLHLFAFIVGERDWDTLRRQQDTKPKPHTSYQPNPEALHIALKSLGLQLSLEDAMSVLAQIAWPSDYVPLFNTLPKHEDGQVIVPLIFLNSHIFRRQKKRDRNCVQKRLALWDFNGNISLEHILYTGESLNGYDKFQFYALLALHPNDTPVGREFYVAQEQVEELLGGSISAASFEASLARMRDCRLDIPMLEFFGPLIAQFRRVRNKVPGKKAYSLRLNPQLVKLYRDDLYSHFMSKGGLFHHRPRYEDTHPFGSYRKAKRRLDTLRDVDFAAYCAELAKPWPTQDADMAAINAILSRHAKDGAFTFKLLDEYRNLGDGEFELTLPDWMWDALLHFVDLYGDEAGSVIFLKAVERFIAPLCEAAE